MSRISSRPPVGPICQAELITDTERYGSGGQCCLPAVGEREGHPVCWVHLGAIRQLTFVKTPDDSHLTP